MSSPPVQEQEQRPRRCMLNDLNRKCPLAQKLQQLHAKTGRIELPFRVCLRQAVRSSIGGHMCELQCKGIFDPANAQAVADGRQRGGNTAVEEHKGIHDPANAQAVADGRQRGGFNRIDAQVTIATVQGLPELREAIDQVARDQGLQGIHVELEGSEDHVRAYRASDNHKYLYWRFTKGLCISIGLPEELYHADSPRHVAAAWLLLAAQRCPPDAAGERTFCVMMKPTKPLFPRDEWPSLQQRVRAWAHTSASQSQRGPAYDACAAAIISELIPEIEEASAGAPVIVKVTADDLTFNPVTGKASLWGFTANVLPAVEKALETEFRVPSNPSKSKMRNTTSMARLLLMLARLPQPLFSLQDPGPSFEASGAAASRSSAQEGHGGRQAVQKAPEDEDEELHRVLQRSLKDRGPPAQASSHPGTMSAGDPGPSTQARAPRSTAAEQTTHRRSSRAAAQKHPSLKGMDAEEENSSSCSSSAEDAEESQKKKKRRAVVSGKRGKGGGWGKGKR